MQPAPAQTQTQAPCVYPSSSCYLPVPPRAWSRVQAECTFGLPDPDVSSPSSLSSALLDAQMRRKGNVLQYKGNSSRLTKRQRYARIATGQWVNRNTTWATQSAFSPYSNPNTQKLKRVGDVARIAYNRRTQTFAPTLLPLTCPGQGPVQGPTDDVVVLPDGGQLSCAVQEDECTGRVLQRHVSQRLCHPSTASDVPGPAVPLCWNDGEATWFPRTRTTMSNSGNKWPVNATLFSAIRPLPPTIVGLTATPLSAETPTPALLTLAWTQSESCLPATRFQVWRERNQEGLRLAAIVPATAARDGSGGVEEYTETAVQGGTYTFLVVAANGNVASNGSVPRSVVVDAIAQLGSDV